MTPPQLFHQQRRAEQHLAGASLADWIARGLGLPLPNAAGSPSLPVAPAPTNPLVYVGLTLAAVVAGLAVYNALKKPSRY